MRSVVLILALVLASCATKSNVVDTQPQGSQTATAQSTPVPTKKEVIAPSAGELTCKMGEHIRSVKIMKPESGGCEVVYTKDGQTNSIASAKNDLSHCDKVRDKIKQTSLRLDIPANNKEANLFRFCFLLFVAFLFGCGSQVAPLRLEEELR